MSRRVVLVDFPWSRDGDPRLPLGHASLLASLQSAGVSVQSLVRPVNETTSAPGIAHAILEAGQGFLARDFDVAVGVYVWSERLVQEVLASLRRLGFKGRISLGGPQVTYAAPGVAGLYPDADVFIRGWGESALVSLTATDQARDIPGVVYRGGSDEGAQAVADPSALVSPWLGLDASPTEGDFVRWETQRGCPYRCAFCQHRDAGGAVLPFPWSRVEAEISLLCRSRVGEVAVLDPVFNLPGRGEAVLEAFARRGFAGKLSLQCRAELVTERFLDAAEALDVTLEFGLQTIHSAEAAAIGRANDLAKVSRALASVRRRGLDCQVSLIFGLPLQTPSSFEASVQWCLERRVPTIKAFPLMLLRGTRLASQRREFGLVEGGEAMPVVVASNTFDTGEWAAMDALSRGLRRTEGAHPLDLEGLRAAALTSAPVSSRWQPQGNHDATHP